MLNQDCFVNKVAFSL